MQTSSEGLLEALSSRDRYQPLPLTRVASITTPLTASGRPRVLDAYVSDFVARVYKKSKEKTPCVLPGVLAPRNQASRGPIEMAYTTHLILDLDHVTDLGRLRDSLQGLVAHAGWETYSSQETVTRLRLVIPLCERLEPSLYPIAYKAVADYLLPGWESDGSVDLACARPTQKAVLPCTLASGRDPLTWYEDGPALSLDAEWLAPSLEARMQAWKEQRRTASRRPRESQDPAVRAFNEVYEDLSLLSAAYGESMGCTYEPSRNGSWTWVGADGTRATEGGVVPSTAVDGAYVDFYGSSPLVGRVIFPFDILMAQSRLHQGLPYEEVMPKADNLFKAAASALADTVSSDPRVASRVDENSSEALTAPSSASTAVKVPQVEDVGDLSLAAVLQARRGKSKDKELTDAECGIVAERSVALRSVWRLRGGLYYRDTPSGAVPLTDDEQEVLFQDVLAECGPVERISGSRRRAILALVSREEGRDRDPFRDLLEASADEWRASGEVRLTDEDGGITPGAEPTELNRVYFATLVRSIAARTLFPGIRYEHVTVLQGGQSAGKTSLATAMSGEYLLGSSLTQGVTAQALRRIDSETERHSTMTRLSQGSVALLDEVSEVRDPEVSAALKTLTSSTSWSATGKYKVSPTSQPLTFVLVGTTNSSAFLPADGGIRRYNVYEITRGDDPVVTEIIAPGSALCRSLLGEAAAWVQDTYSNAVEAARVGGLDEDTAHRSALEILSRRLNAPLRSGGTLYREHLAQASRFATMGEVVYALRSCAEAGFPDTDGSVSVDPRTLAMALQGVGLVPGSSSVRMALEFHVYRLGGTLRGDGWVTIPYTSLVEGGVVR